MVSVPPTTLGRQFPAPLSWADRALALVEVGLCSDIPTQILSAGLVAALGVTPPRPGGPLRLDYVGPVLMLDTALLIGLILFFSRLRGDNRRALFFGDLPLWHDLRLVLPAAVGALLVAGTALTLIRALAPGLHTVATNPFHALVANGGDAIALAALGIVAGGVREEVQRAFVLRRFERYLGGATVGLVVSSLAFGAGHLLQGADTGIVTAALGAFWGVIYLRRSSIMAPMLSHAVFNTVQVGALLMARPVAA